VGSLLLLEHRRGVVTREGMCRRQGRHYLLVLFGLPRARWPIACCWAALPCITVPKTGIVYMPGLALPCLGPMVPLCAGGPGPEPEWERAKHVDRNVT
jgi:hypothetical protein